MHAPAETLYPPHGTTPHLILQHPTPPTSFLPLGSVWLQRPRSTAGSARFLSGLPTIRPCTRSLQRRTGGGGVGVSPSDE